MVSVLVYGVGVGAGEKDANMTSPSCFSGVRGRVAGCVNHSGVGVGTGETEVNAKSFCSSGVRGKEVGCVSQSSSKHRPVVRVFV